MLKTSADNFNAALTVVEPYILAYSYVKDDTTTHTMTLSFTIGFATSSPSNAGAYELRVEVIDTTDN